MTKKILLIIGILAVIGVALFLVFGSKPQTAGEEGGGFSIRDYLPFGNSIDTLMLGRQKQQAAPALLGL